MLELVFVTSNFEKLEHARYLCRDYTVRVSKQKHYGVGYCEPRVTDRGILINQSVKDAIRRWRKNVSNADNKFFFIEDTSVIIDALSKNKEFPGVDVKYWMLENDFHSVNKQLIDAGNNCRARVRSDLILILPVVLRELLNEVYIPFTSSVEGRIVDKEIEIKTQALYPWLSSRTFNKWFIPNGCRGPLSSLPINVADKHDFRAGAFSQMLEFLEKRGFIRKRSGQEKQGHQIPFLPGTLSFVVCGPPCAGKTTLAMHLTAQFGYYHIEASDYMYLAYYERHGAHSNIDINDFAQQALLSNARIVVDQIISGLDDLARIPLVITGFRTPDEIKSFVNEYPGSSDLKVVYLDAHKSKRYIRSQFRNRRVTPASREHFDRIDQQQHAMGLSEVRRRFAGSIIKNNSTIERYLESFVSNFHLELQRSADLLRSSAVHLRRYRTLEAQIMSVLSEEFTSGVYYTTAGIARLINQRLSASDTAKSKNNVSRYFNQNFYPYYEIKLKDGKKSYRLSQTGLSRANFIKRLAERSTSCPSDARES